MRNVYESNLWVYKCFKLSGTYLTNNLLFFKSENLVLSNYGFLNQNISLKIHEMIFYV